MSGTSAFARMVGLTRSFGAKSSTSGRPAAASDDAAQAEVVEILAAAAEEAPASDTFEVAPGDFAVILDAHDAEDAGDETGDDAETTADDEAEGAIAPDLDAAMPPGAALAQVTVVDTTQAGELPSLQTVEAELGTSVATDALGAIEADIATLLASLDTLSDAAPVEDGDEPMQGANDDDDLEAADEATLTLLGELNRLWQADPAVASHGAR